MRILLNALFLIPGRVGGSETYVRGLVMGLAQVDTHNVYLLCLAPEAAATVRPPNDRWRIIASPLGSAKRPLRMLAEQAWLPAIARRACIDLTHSLGYTGPLVTSGARVTSIHDMNYRRHPEDLTIIEHLSYEALIPQVVRRSHHVIAMSRAARSDILRWTNASPDRVSAIPEAPRPDWPGDPRDDPLRLAAAGVSRPFVLSVAASYPHKNLARLLQAFVLERGQEQAITLVCVGLRGLAHPMLRSMAGTVPGHIKLLGWVDDALLGTLYRQAELLAFPSLYEGFGLPILEAMALNTPVLTSNYGAMAEVANDAAELVDPRDVDSIRRGLHRLLVDERRREELRQLGRQRAAQFSWLQTAERTQAVYEAVFSSSFLSFAAR
jgi:glycosyltransferase involved in cell wall biosynthesis